MTRDLSVRTLPSTKSCVQNRSIFLSPFFACGKYPFTTHLEVVERLVIQNFQRTLQSQKAACFLSNSSCSSSCVSQEFSVILYFILLIPIYDDQIASIHGDPFQKKPESSKDFSSKEVNL